MPSDAEATIPGARLLKDNPSLPRIVFPVIRKMETRENRISVPREPHRLSAIVFAAIGSIFASKDKPRKRRQEVRFVSWAGRATSDSWFAFEIQQKRNQAL